MLKQIRDNVQHPALKVLLGLIIVVFIFFFGGGGGGNRTQGIAKVNGVDISQAEYNDTYSGLLNLYEQVTQQPLSAEQAKQMALGRRALDMLIDRVLLLEYADEMDLEVSNDEVSSAIRAQEAFFENGRFSNDRFLQILGFQGTTPGRYKKLKRSELLLAKAEAAVKGMAVVSDDEVEKEFRDKYTKIAAEYVSFSPDDHSLLAKVTDETLADFHQAEGEKFRTEERRSAKYIMFDIEEFVDAAKVGEEELASEYRIRSFKYVEPETIHARHILFRVEAGQNAEAWQKADEKASSIREKIIAGEAFKAAAKKYSQDTATNFTGGDLGVFGRNVMPPEFEQAAFNLPEGEVSEPVRSSMGYHLILVETHNTAHQKPLDQVRDELVGLIKHEKARELAFQAADNALMDLEDKTYTWDTLPDGVKAETTALVSLRQNDASLPAIEGFADGLFKMPENSPGDIIDTAEGAYLFAVASREPSVVPPLADIRGAVEARFRVVEGRNLARKAAEAFATAAAQGSWEETLKASGLDTSTTETVTAKGANLPPLGYSPDAKEALFTKTEAGRVLDKAFEISGKFVALKIAAVTEPDMANLEMERAQITTELLPRLRDAELDKMLEKLRAGAEIEVQESFLR